MIHPQGFWYPKLFPKQLQVFNSRARALLVSGPRLCTVPDAIVYSGDGLKRLKRFRPKAMLQDGTGHIDEPICSWDGKQIVPALATKFVDQTNRDALRAELANGYAITGSPIHPIWCCWKDTETRFGYLTLTEIQEKVKSSQAVYVPLLSHPNFTKTKLQVVAGVEVSEDVGYLLGALVGDGACSGSSVGFTNIDAECIARVRKAVNSLGGVMGQSRTVPGQFWLTYCPKLRDLITACDLRKTSYFKRIPDCIIESPKAVLCAFLRGLFDTDGTVEKAGTVSFTTTSDKLADDVQQSLSALGILSVRRSKKSASGRPTWNIYIMGNQRLAFLEQVGFEIKRKAARIKVKNGFSRSYGYPQFLKSDLLAIKKSFQRRCCKGRQKQIRFKPRVGLAWTRWYLNQALPWIEKPLTMSTLVESEALVCAANLEAIRHEYFEEHHRPRSWHRSRRFLTMTTHIPNPNRLAKIISELRIDQSLDNYLISDSWIKVESVTACESELMDLCVPDLNSFLAGGFINHNSGKTRATLHRLIRHMWETPDARVAMFSRTLKNAKDGGGWSLLHSVILPEWIKAGIGLRYTTKTAEKRPGPKVDGLSRTPFFRIRNMHGGESECFLFSLDYDPDVEDKLKEMEFSLIYFAELSKFHDRRILSVALLSLRMSHISFDDHMWLADTNPADEGELSWIYKVFYIERTQSYEDYTLYQKKLGLPVLEQRLFTAFQRDLDLIEIKPEENTWLDPRQLDELKTECSYDEGMWAKYVEGKWIFGEGNASLHFRSYFKRNLHVIGDVSAPNEEEWTYANPHPSSFELITGWDLADVNHAAVVIDRTILNGLSHFTIVDEQVSVGEKVSIRTFTENFMELIEDLEKMKSQQPYNLERAWSDRSSIERYNAVADTFPYLEVYAASNERIFLRALPRAKSKGAVRIRVQLLKQLLHHGRLKVSAHCTHVITMFETLKKGRVDFIPIEDPQKHIFDALSYALFMECAEELENLPATENQRNKRSLAVQVR